MVSDWQCWQALFTTYAMSRRENVKYWRSPIIHLYSLVSMDLFSLDEVETLIAIGVVIWEVSDIFTQLGKSFVYFDEERNQPQGKYLTSNLKNINNVLCLNL